MLQIIHISDLHLIAPSHWNSLKARLAKIPPLAHFYAVAAPHIRDKGLPEAIEHVALSSPAPSVLVLTGDIAANPSASGPAIDDHFDYIEELRKRLRSSLPLGSEFLAVLGNHDWEDDDTTNFSGSQFQQIYRITEPRILPLIHVGGVKCIFFLIDSNNGFLPGYGLVDDTTLTCLEGWFQDGPRGGISGISREDYNEAAKILLLHHPPLPVSAYRGAFSPFHYRMCIGLQNAQRLHQICADHIDMFLFGHTHIPTCQPFGGFVMVNAGPTLMMPPPSSWFLPNFQVIRIVDRDTIEVETFYWVNARFSSLGYKPVTFRRGIGGGAIRGTAGWV